MERIPACDIELQECRRRRRSAVDVGGVPMKEVSQRSVRFVGMLGLRVAACGSVRSHEMPSL
jgi:hypothetical protein